MIALLFSCGILWKVIRVVTLEFKNNTVQLNVLRIKAVQFRYLQSPDFQNFKQSWKIINT